MTTAAAGALACQRDSYLKELTTKVISCEAGQITSLVGGKKQKIQGYEVILQDTVLFPEGGGQPDDKGTINDIEVLQVSRHGENAVHFVPAPLDPGTEVKLKVNWTRRWDNMQQHSGQHLITAIADSHFGYKTTSWNLGERTSFIELDTPKMAEEEIYQLEKMVNEKIVEGVRMFPTTYDSKDDPRIQEVRCRGLPDDHVGPVRIVTIEGVDDNTCCGTHMSTLAHLQCVKLLGAEKGKKGKTNLVFLVGQRVLNYLASAYSNEKAFTALLKSGPDQHVELLSKLQNSFKVAQKSATTLLRDVAVLEGQKFKTSPDKQPFLFMHRKEGDNEFMNMLANEINDPNVVIFLSTGDERGAGLFLLSGTEELVAEIGPKVAELIQGKGAAKKGRFQGKANKLSKRPLAENLIREHLGISAPSS